MAHAEYENIKESLGVLAFHRITKEFNERQKEEEKEEEKIDKKDSYDTYEKEFSKLYDKLENSSESSTTKSPSISTVEKNNYPKFSITEFSNLKMCNLTFKNDSSIGGTISNPDRGDPITVFIKNDRGELRREEIPNLPHIAEAFPRLLENCELNHANINSFIYDAKEMNAEEFYEKYPIPESTKESSLENNFDLEY